jgi:5-methyltetrahydrofolate--homocysteine methyltransferase
MSIEAVYQAVMEGDAGKATSLVSAALESGVAAGDILNKGCIAAMGEVGRLFEEGEMFVPEMLIAARAMQAGMEVLKPHLAEGEIVSTGKAVIGTVAGDLHDIGKNLVAFMLDINGFEVFDLGIDVQPQSFVDKIKEVRPEIVGMSGFLTSVYQAMKDTVDAIDEAGLRDTVKIMIGGGVMDEEVKRFSGADAYGPDAMAAVDLAKNWTGGA